LTCAILLGGSLRSEKYVSRQMTRTCREEKTSARTVRPKALRAKAIKKGTAKPEEAFLGKVKHMRFAVTRRRKIIVKYLRNKGKTSPEENVKNFRAFNERECSEYPSGLLPDTSHPCLLRLQLAAASSYIQNSTPHILVPRVRKDDAR
jgi:hypothetical protein